MVLAEVAATGLCGGALGVAAAWPRWAWADGAILARLPKLSFLPDRLFAVEWGLAASCLAGAMLVSALAALPVIVRLARKPPAQLVSED